jgi:hypothetical protein
MSQCTATIAASSNVNSSIKTSITFTVNPVTVTLTPPASTTIIEGQTSAAISATLNNNGTSDSTLNWTVTPAGCGTVSSSTGSSVTYTAPTPIPAACSNAATVAVASDAAPLATASVKFTLTPISVTISPSTAQTVVEGGSLTITGSANDSKGVSWSLGSGSCGSLASATSSGVSFVAPTSLSSTCTATVVAASKTNGTITQSVGITVNPITVTISSPASPVAVQSGAAATTITATTTDPAGASTLQWTLTPTSGCGSLSATTGASVGYTPPTTLTTGCSATARAASSTDGNHSASVTFNVTPAPIVLTLVNPAPSSGNTASSTLGYAGTLTVTATLYNDATSGGGIGYTLTSGCGVFSGMALSGTSGATNTYSGTYTAPSATCTATLTLAANAAAAQTATVNLSVQPGISVTLNPAGPLNVDANSPLSITPTVNNDSAGKGVNLSLNPTSGCGSLSAASANSGTAFTYNPPSSMTASCSATVTATSISSSSKSASLALTVYPSLTLQSTTALGSATVGASFSGYVNVSGGLAPFSWSVTGLADSISAGSTTGSTLTLSSTDVTSTTATPTAPDTVTAQVTVKDATGTSVSGSYTISVYGYATVTLPAETLASATNGSGYSAAINASGGAQTYTFTVNGTSIPTTGTATPISSADGLTGSSSGGNTLTIGGTPSVTSTPAAITLNVSVKDGEGNSASQPYSITVNAASSPCGSGNEAALKGQYAFLLSGYNSIGYLGAVGSFTADGKGHISAGTVDANGTYDNSGNGLGPQSGSITASSSSYSVGSDGRGCATIVTPFYTFTTRFALDLTGSPAPRGELEEWESGATPYIATGVLRQQSGLPSALTSGIWVYEQNGVFATSGPGTRLGIVGTQTVSGGAITSGEYDSNWVGTVKNHTGITGTFTTPDSTTGRLTITTTLSGISATRAVYLIDGYERLEITTDSIKTLYNILVGYAKLQNLPTGSSALSGKMVYYASGMEISGAGSFVQFALINASGSSYTGDVYEDDAGTWASSSPTTPTCSFTIDGNGRVATSGSSCGTYYSNSTWADAPVFYLTSPNTGFILGTDPGVLIGQLMPQLATSITAHTYVTRTQEVVNENMESQVGFVSLTAAGAVTGTSDYTSVSSPETGADQSTSVTLTLNSDGTFSSSDHPGRVSGVVVSTAEAIVVNNQGNSYPNIMIVEYLPPI